MPQDTIDCVLIEYFSEDYFCLWGEFSLFLQGLSLAPALQQLNCIQFLTIKFQLVKGESMMLDDFDIREL